MKEKILLVDDEQEIITFMRDALTDQGYEVLTASDGQEAIEQAQKGPDLIILDVMMPGMDGFEVCQILRESYVYPILFLSARQSETDRIKGLAVGGDDYLVKPFSLRELLARVEAHLRREKRIQLKEETGFLHFGSLSVNLKGYEATYEGRLIPLTSREFQVLELFILHPGQVFSREQIYEKVWGYDALGSDVTVTEHVKKIRAKLAVMDPKTEYITTVWGIGYKWGVK